MFKIPGGVPDEVASDWLCGFTVDVRLAQFEQLFFELWVGAGRDPQVCLHFRHRIIVDIDIPLRLLQPA